MVSSINTSRILFFVALWLAASALSVSQTAGRQASPSQSQDRQLQQAANELSAGKLDQAAQDLQAVLHSDPEDYRALDLLGVVRVLQHREADAQGLFEQVVKARPEFAAGRAHLGLLYLHLGRDQNALPELRQALRLDSSRTDVAAALAHVLEGEAKAASAAGDLNGALGFLIEAREHAPDNADVQFEFGVAAHKLSLDDDAIEAFRQTLKLRKNDAPALYDLGFALMDRARFEDARLRFAQYVELRPDDPSGHCALGMALAALEQSQLARAQFEISIRLASTQSESYYRLGLLDLNAGEYDAAAQHLQKALEHKPNDGDALTALGKVEFEQRHYPNAISLLQQAVSQDDSIQEAQYYLGLALARVGRKQESNQQLETAARLEQEQKGRSRNLLRLRKPESFGKQEPDPPQ